MKNKTMRYRIRQARLRAGMTQLEASKLIGINRHTLSKWEKIGFRADSQRLILLSQIYKTHIESLMPDKPEVEFTNIIFYRTKIKL